MTVTGHRITLRLPASPRTVAGGGGGAETVYLRTIGGAPRGGNKDGEADEIMRGEPLAPVPISDIAVTGGKIRIDDFAAYLVALITNSRSDQIAMVTDNNEQSDRRSVNVEFHNGDHAYLMFYKTVPAGRGDSDAWRTLPAI
ncbi:hypothetical protein GCM10017673_51170 [Streptosporangium violaceochromogenes]|nr:hypothetical protein GCM10017673_51170 [Streptosporangium violaceochromogenes]